MVDDVRFLVTMRDVTLAKRAEAAERAEERQRTLLQFQQQALLNLDVAFDLIAQLEVKDGVSTRLWSSSSHYTVLGHEPTTCNGDVTTLTKLYPATFLRDELPGLIAAFERGKIVDGLTGEHALLHADGHEVWFEWRLSLDKQCPRRFLLMFRDITDRRERHRLEVENARLEVARQKDEEATHMLAHELKNRFIGVRGHVENAQLTVEEKAGHLLQAPHNLQEAFADATAAVDRGLFLCMNRAVTLQLVHGAYEPRSMDMDVAKELLVASAKRCDVHVDASVPRVVRLDGNLLLFVAENFIANAQNYGPLGRGDDKSITLRASCEGARLRIVVTNNPGLRHADARREYGDGDATARILDKGGLQKSATSTGHGLRIVKRCVDMLRGSTSLRFLANRVEASLSVPFAVVEHGKKVDLPPASASRRSTTPTTSGRWTPTASRRWASTRCCAGPPPTKSRRSPPLWRACDRRRRSSSSTRTSTTDAAAVCQRDRPHRSPARRGLREQGRDPLRQPGERRPRSVSRVRRGCVPRQGPLAGGVCARAGQHPGRHVDLEWRRRVEAVRRRPLGAARERVREARAAIPRGSATARGRGGRGRGVGRGAPGEGAGADARRQGGGERVRGAAIWLDRPALRARGDGGARGAVCPLCQRRAHGGGGGAAAAACRQPRVRGLVPCAQPGLHRRAAPGARARCAVRRHPPPTLGMQLDGRGIAPGTLCAEGGEERRAVWRRPVRPARVHLAGHARRRRPACAAATRGGVGVGRVSVGRKGQKMLRGLQVKLPHLGKTPRTLFKNSIFFKLEKSPHLKHSSKMRGLARGGRGMWNMPGAAGRHKPQACYGCDKNYKNVQEPWQNIRFTYTATLRSWGTTYPISRALLENKDPTASKRPRGPRK